ncbi:MAG: alpha/beta fold hydrolase [Gemmatimonadaceae bacterium]
MIAVSDGVEIAYDDLGTGVPVVFIHGFPHNRTLWAPQFGAFLDRCRCIAPDLRGFGESAAAPPFTVDRYADDVAKLLTTLGIDRAVIVGLSMGGYVAFAFWRRHHDRARGLVLADTRAGADDAEGVEKRRALIELAREQGSAAVAAAQITGMVGRSTREKHPDIVDAVYAMLETATVEGIVGALEAMIARPDSTATLQTIDVPALIIVGDEDVLTPVAHAREMHRLIAGSRLEILSGAGHLSNFERAAAFNHVVSEFLGTLTYA